MNETTEIVSTGDAVDQPSEAMTPDLTWVWVVLALIVGMLLGKLFFGSSKLKKENEQLEADLKAAVADCRKAADNNEHGVKVREGLDKENAALKESVSQLEAAYKSDSERYAQTLADRNAEIEALSAKPDQSNEIAKLTKELDQQTAAFDKERSRAETLAGQLKAAKDVIQQYSKSDTVKDMKELEKFRGYWAVTAGNWKKTIKRKATAAAKAS